MESDPLILVIYQPVISYLCAAIGMALCMIDTLLMLLWLTQFPNLSVFPRANKYVNESETTFRVVLSFSFCFISRVSTIVVLNVGTSMVLADFRHKMTVMQERPSPDSPPTSPSYVPRLKAIACEFIC